MGCCTGRQTSGSGCWGLMICDSALGVPGRTCEATQGATPVLGLSVGAWGVLVMLGVSTTGTVHGCDLGSNLLPAHVCARVRCKWGEEMVMAGQLRGIQGWGWVPAWDGGWLRLLMGRGSVGKIACVGNSCWQLLHLDAHDSGAGAGHSSWLVLHAR